MYSNQKPWMNRDVRLLLKARNIAFRSGDAQTYSTARANLKRGIKKAKHGYKLKVEGHFSNSNPRSMWQGIQVTSNYKPINPSPPSTDISFLNELNNFYARFEKDNHEQASKVELTAGHQLLTFSTTDVRAELSRINPRKAAGPDGIPGRAFHPSLSQWLSSSSTHSHHNKVLRAAGLGTTQICLPPTLDPHQYAYHFSSAFNTVIPSKLITKLRDLGISTSICNWLLDFLTNRPQHVRLDHHCSPTLTVNTGVPQGCVMSPFLYSLFTHDCRALHGSNTIIKFADDTTVIGLIKDNDESAYREEVDRLATWCHNNNLLLNTNKTKELVLDFRRKTGIHPPIHINGAAVERVSSFKFLGIHLSQDLTWTTNCSSLVKKAHQRLFFLRTLKKHHLSSDILVNFFRCTIESILTSCITVWYGNCSASDQKALQKVVKTAQRIAAASLPAIEDIYRRRCHRRAKKVTKDSCHPAHGLFTLMPSGRRYRSLRTKTSRFRNSFFPTAVSLLNSDPSHFTSLQAQ
ncbi:putative RNA-directed DNA polymerase from transposon BS [Takifugu flavidus]|uniref:Putative RNA-directed DNA polymerase from transposon BS n=1 Tax=Takifugu flavidus TaxID=433684 RepID=A0A5C6P766_9TELE|nr:putative RNA-directed DNA polymerase from transposon BS [Takifugu flavidus]